MKIFPQWRSKYNSEICQISKHLQQLNFSSLEILGKLKFNLIIKFVKTSKNGENSLGVYLCSNAIFFGRVEKIIVAGATITALSRRMMVQHKQTINVSPFLGLKSVWGVDEFITWNELLNPANGYSTQDNCELKIEVKATKSLNAMQNEWLKFEDITVREYAGVHKKFRMIIHQIYNYHRCLFTRNSVQWVFMAYCS